MTSHYMLPFIKKFTFNVQSHSKSLSNRSTILYEKYGTLFMYWTVQLLEILKGCPLKWEYDWIPDTLICWIMYSNAMTAWNSSPTETTHHHSVAIQHLVLYIWYRTGHLFWFQRKTFITLNKDCGRFVVSPRVLRFAPPIKLTATI